MSNLNTELITRIDRAVINNPRVFAKSAKTLKEEFERVKATTAYPIFRVLTTVARRATDEFRTDRKNATLILLIAWMTNKSDAKLEMLNLQEFSEFDTKDLSDCREWARITRDENSDWPDMVGKALSVVEPELQHKEIKGWYTMLKKNWKLFVAILTILAIVIGILVPHNI